MEAMENLKFNVITFGCQMNARDSQWLSSSLEKRGFKPAPVAEASVIILNTCSVREKPEQKLRSALRRLERETRPDTLFCVCGCAAQQLGDALLRLSPRARLVLGTDAIVHAPDLICRLLQIPQETIVLLDFEDDYPEREADIQKGLSAFVNIMQGCDNFCSYCIVPFTRGRQKSRRKQDILSECRRRIEEGALEITLLGQNVNAWGKDSGEADFSSLLQDVASLDGLTRLRFVTPHPADMTADIVEDFGRLDNLCPRLHLPLQSGSDKVLKAMRRRYTAGDYLKLLENLHDARPDITLTTDLIVGFPGETEQDFQETLSLVESAGFVSSYSFCYSDRPGARAALMPDKVPGPVSKDRLLRLQSLQEKLSRRWLDGRVGQVAEILLEGKSPRGDNTWQGRDAYGDIIHVPFAVSPQSSLLTVRITEAKKHSLVGKLL